jgi:glucokinase-like ROK family protein
LLEFDPQAGCIVGVEIGVDFISVIVTNFAAEIIWRQREPIDLREGQAAIIRRALDIMAEAVKHAKSDGGHILGLGLGVPGLVDVSTGTLLFGPNLGWRNVPFSQILHDQFDFPVYVDNEANMGALGESYFGAARAARLVLYVSAGVGIGGGIVLDGRIMPGSTGFAGEVGHMTIAPDGLRCNCGNLGCWETLASQSAVFRRVRESIDRGRPSKLAELTRGKWEALTIPLIVQAAQGGDRVALDALHDTGVYLGIGLANLVNALNPERVVFGGILSTAGEFLIPVIKRVIAERALRWSSEAVQVLVAAHGSDACVIGGIATVFHQVLSQPLKSVRNN